jgi:magnesium transporter
MSRAILFEGDETTQLDELRQKPEELGAGMLLWVDLAGDRHDDVAEVAGVLGIDDDTQRQLAERQDSAGFRDRGRYLHITMYAPRADDEERLHAVECVVGENWVVTAHDRPVPVLDAFGDRAAGSGDTGSLTGPAFLAALLEWVLASYTAAFDRIEERLEEFAVDAMRGVRGDEDIEKLVEVRRRIGHLARALAAHRSALIALNQPELEALGDAESGRRFESLYARFESTLQEARDARESVVGSFDVLIARSGHETNHIMKVLTLASVILLPGSLIAGVMGMNFQVGVFDHPGFFWVVLGVIVAVAPVTLLVAQRRGWI